MIMRFVEETDGKSFVQVNDGSKKDEKEYASKGVAGTALGLGIAGTALWLLNGGLGNCGLYHTKANGIVCRGEVFTVEDAKAIYDKHVRNINREITYWDVYVAVNAQYHDYVRLYQDWFPNLTEEQLDEKVIYSAINFWFKDEDAGTGKVWNYFKEI